MAGKYRMDFGDLRSAMQHKDINRTKDILALWKEAPELALAYIRGHDMAYDLSGWASNPNASSKLITSTHWNADWPMVKYIEVRGIKYILAMVDVNSPLPGIWCHEYVFKVGYEAFWRPWFDAHHEQHKFQKMDDLIQTLLAQSYIWDEDIRRKIYVESVGMALDEDIKDVELRIIRAVLSSFSANSIMNAALMLSSTYREAATRDGSKPSPVVFDTVLTQLERSLDGYLTERCSVPDNPIMP